MARFSSIWCHSTAQKYSLYIDEDDEARGLPLLLLLEVVADLEAYTGWGNSDSVSDNLDLFLDGELYLALE